MDEEIEALKAGEREAWAALYERLADAVYQHALFRLHGDSTTAEDITHEVFIRAIESIQGFEPAKGTLRQWVLGVAGRVLARRARSLRPAAARALSLAGGTEHDASCPLPEPADPRPLADQQLIQREEQRLTATALAMLPPHWEQALRWKYTEGLHVEEIARRMGLSAKAAESLLSRARAAFRESYAELLASSRESAFLVEETHNA